MKSKFVIVLVLGLTGSISAMESRAEKRVSIRVLSSNRNSVRSIKRDTVHVYQNVSDITTLQSRLIKGIESRDCNSTDASIKELVAIDKQGLNFVDSQTGMSPLIMSILLKDLSYAEIFTRQLIENGASVQEPKFDGRNPLEYAFDSKLSKELVVDMVAIMHNRAI